MKKIAILIFPDFMILDATGPLAAFEIADRHMPGQYQVQICAITPGPVRSSSGAELLAEKLPPPSKLHTLLIAGGDGTRAASEDKKLLAYVRRAAAAGVRVASVCSGSYVLAATGLLDGRPATTHWSLSDDFRARFPRVSLEPDRIFVRAGQCWSSAGITAGIDLALALVAEDLGDTVSASVARYLVVYHRRPGGQSQFSALLDLDRPENRFGPLLDKVRATLDRPWDVESMAAQAGMSPRHFARAFRAETGLTPAKAVEKLRAEAARAAFDSGARSVQTVAAKVGFRDADRMRRAFLRNFKTVPSALKRGARPAALQ